MKSERIENRKGMFALVAILAAYAVVGTLDYEDEIRKQNVNCNNSVYAFDNEFCGEVYEK